MSTEALERQDPEHTSYQLFMLVLCGLALLVLSTDEFFAWSSSTRTILGYADDAICVAFLLDFGVSIIRAPRKWHYLITWGWIDLVSSIPALDVLRWGRAARVIRVIRVLRGVRSARAMAHFVVKRKAESAFLASMLLSILLVVSCSIAILEFEIPGGGNITSAEDAMWWAISTMTTVGYGDRYPVTTEGRLVAIFLMAAGVGLFGTVSGVVASWFLSPAVEEADGDILEVKAMLQRLIDERRTLTRTTANGSDSPGSGDYGSIGDAEV